MKFTFQQICTKCKNIAVSHGTCLNPQDAISVKYHDDCPKCRDKSKDWISQAKEKRYQQEYFRDL